MTHASAAPVQATATVAPPAIPFRKSAATSAPEVLGLLATTLVLLAATGAILWYLRRRGWLDRWVGATPVTLPAGKRLVILESLRLSRLTTVHRIGDGDRVFLLAESSGHVHLVDTATTHGGVP